MSFNPIFKIVSIIPGIEILEPDLTETSNGFELAEVDLELRGEGEVWGTSQSGYTSSLRAARVTDRALLLEARNLAEEIIRLDPDLSSLEHSDLRSGMAQYQQSTAEAN